MRIHSCSWGAGGASRFGDVAPTVSSSLFFRKKLNTKKSEWKLQLIWALVLRSDETSIAINHKPTTSYRKPVILQKILVSTSFVLIQMCDRKCIKKHPQPTRFEYQIVYINVDSYNLGVLRGMWMRQPQAAHGHTPIRASSFQSDFG